MTQYDLIKNEKREHCDFVRD